MEKENPLLKIILEQHAIDELRGGLQCDMRLYGDGRTLARMLAILFVKRPELLVLIQHALQEMDNIKEVEEITLPEL
jgi:hypothetical protein